LNVDWLPQVGGKGWIVLTKDDKISKNQLERIAVACAQIKMFVLAS
jgi:GTP-binding protein EngB required for normal cell division